MSREIASFSTGGCEESREGDRDIALVRFHNFHGGNRNPRHIFILVQNSHRTSRLYIVFVSSARNTESSKLHKTVLTCISVFRILIDLNFISFEYNSEYLSLSFSAREHNTHTSGRIPGDGRAIYFARIPICLGRKQRNIESACQKSSRYRVYLPFRYFFKPARTNRCTVSRTLSRPTFANTNLPISASRPCVVIFPRLPCARNYL